MGPATAHAQAEFPVVLDREFNGSAPPLFAAIDEGYFEEKGMSETIEAGKGSLYAIPRVATGASPIGRADIDSPIRFLDQNPDAPLIAAMT